MQSDTKDSAEILDGLVTWMETRWRAIVYSFLAGIVFTMACATCSTASAADYTKPVGAPEIFVENHGVTVAVFAVNTPVGEGIGIFEKRATGFYLCGSCLVSPETPSMEAEVAAAGGPGPYIEAKRADINAVLMIRYPAVMPPPNGSALSMVNQSLATNFLRLVDGAPQLGPH